MESHQGVCSGYNTNSPPTAYAGGLGQGVYCVAARYTPVIQYKYILLIKYI